MRFSVEVSGREGRGSSGARAFSFLPVTNNGRSEVAHEGNDR